MIDLRQSPPIRVHLHRHPHPVALSPTLLPGRTTPRGLLARWATAGTNSQLQLATDDPGATVTAYDDDWFAGRPATP